MRSVLTLAAFAAPLAASDIPPGFQSGTTRWNGKPAPRGEALLRRAMIDEHNQARRAYGSAKLDWDDALARDAGKYAAVLAKRDRIAHDPQKDVIPRQGENLFMGTRSAYSYKAMARLWVDERRWFKKGRFPQVVTEGPWTRVGHYTQIVWPSTQRFGCATASNRERDFLVCRYLPAGNYFGVELR